MRYPSVAGSFYDSDKAKVRSNIDGWLQKAADELKDKEIRSPIAAVVPHAGHEFSGWIASYAYQTLRQLPAWTPFVILGPNHTGRGKPVALSKEDWMTPLGTVKNDRELGDCIDKISKLLDFDEEAHTFEHSIEVQLPFLQTILKEFRIIPICMGVQNYDAANEIGDAIYSASRSTGKIPIVIASSDFTHYEPAEIAKEKDLRAISLLEKMEIKQFIDLVESEGLSLCGYGPIAAAAIYAQKMGAKAELLKYGNSGDVTGDYSSVVGYASLVFHR